MGIFQITVCGSILDTGPFSSFYEQDGFGINCADIEKNFYLDRLCSPTRQVVNNMKSIVEACVHS